MATQIVNEGKFILVEVLQIIRSTEGITNWKTNIPQGLGGNLLGNKHQ